MSEKQVSVVVFGVNQDDHGTHDKKGESYSVVIMS